MQERTLQQAKTEKELECRRDAEEEFWSKFMLNNWDIPVARILQLIVRVQGGGAIPQTARDRMQAAQDVVQRLDALIPQIRAMTTIQEVDAVRWTPTATQ